MAGLSIARRRKAWLQGVLCGATGKGTCFVKLPKLVDIYRKGVEYGKVNLDKPLVRGIVEQQRRKHEKQRPSVTPPPRSGGRRPPPPTRGRWR